MFETTYPYIASAYGLAVGVCFVGFLFSAFRAPMAKAESVGPRGSRNPVGQTSVVMIFTLPLDDRRLASGFSFPVGLAVRSCFNGSGSKRQPRRKRFQQQDGLPRADFFMDFFDYEYSLRARAHGYKIAVISRAELGL